MESDESWDFCQSNHVTSYHKLDLAQNRIILIDNITEFERFLDNMQV